MKNLFLILVNFLLINTISQADGHSGKIYLEGFSACKCN